MEKQEGEHLNLLWWWIKEFKCRVKLGIRNLETICSISKNKSGDIPKDNPEDYHEDNPEDIKQVRDGTTDMAVEHSSAAAWTPIRVRKVKLGVERNLGISPKSLKKEKKLKIGKKSRKKYQN